MDVLHTQKKSRSSSQSSCSTTTDEEDLIQQSCEMGAWEPPTHRRKTTPKHPDYFKGMEKLPTHDEAFALPWEVANDIMRIIISRKTPTPEICSQWDEYAISFYLKMCTCFRVDYHHLEDEEVVEDDQFVKTPSPTINNVPLQPPVQVKIYRTMDEMMADLKEPPPYTPQEDESSDEEGWNGVMPTRSGPFETGVYSPGTKPNHIPYHLYLLVKEAVEIMKRDNNTNQLKDLEIAERKIRFFCTHFYSHLPTGWDYKRDNASSLIADYETKSGPKYDMTGFTPFKNQDRVKVDLETYLAADDIAYIMTIIHSRKTLPFWVISLNAIRFYCQLCSCCGIDYQCLEAASEDDLCLMNMGRTGAPFGFPETV